MSTWGSASTVSGNTELLDARSVRREHEAGRTYWSGTGLSEKTMPDFRPYVWRERPRFAVMVPVVNAVDEAE